MDDLEHLLERVRRRAHGLMPLPVYRRIFESAAACDGGTIVEIGTYRGAATVVMALGARRSGRGARVLTADPLQPGIGAEGSSTVDKIAELRETFEAFGVAGDIEFVQGTSTELVATRDPRSIGLVLLDGGGRVDEDLATLWDRLSPGCTIVIDDVDGRIVVQRRWSDAQINQKNRISRLLVDRFVSAGLLVPRGVVNSTGWYEKASETASGAEIERLALPAYRELIKAIVPAAEIGLGRSLMRSLARTMPGLARAYRRLVPRRR